MNILHEYVFMNMADRIINRPFETFSIQPTFHVRKTRRKTEAAQDCKKRKGSRGRFRHGSQAKDARAEKGDGGSCQETSQEVETGIW